MRYLDLKTIFPIILAFLLAAPAFPKSVDVVPPKVVGLYFYASWCNNCKTLDPALHAAGEALKKEPFLLVQLDVSNKVTQHQAGMTAAQMGYADLYQNTGLKTGFVILVDAKTGEEIDRISKGEDSTAIAAKIKALTKA